MIYRFGAFELDLAAVELRGQGVARSLEPQVFRLLALLIENHGRLVSKDEIIEKVWDGRVVSDAALASRVKSARQALGDDGLSQRFIKTVHRRGFRFIGDIKVVRGAPSHLFSDTTDPNVPQSVGVLVRQLERMSRPSIAVLAFRTIGDDVRCKALASALPDELITELSRLRWLFVTARGSSFRVHTENAAFGEIGQLLGVRYCLWGSLEISDRRLVVTVELVDTCDEGIVWA
ncbi:MAG: winged helix-turn-helix domain-containing protein, partial [Gammaproteobacteria bacterium]|nr:winged helix-turn-helix domain-containing protein [Gammaproteobacteria bacterium]